MNDPSDKHPGDGKFRSDAGDTEREAAERVSKRAMYPMIVRAVRECGPGGFQGRREPMSTCCIQSALKDYYGLDYTHDQLSNRISELVKGEGLPDYILYRVGKDVRANRNYDKTHKMSMQFVHTTIPPLPAPLPGQQQWREHVEEEEEYLKW